MPEKRPSSSAERRPISREATRSRSPRQPYDSHHPERKPRTAPARSSAAPRATAARNPAPKTNPAPRRTGIRRTAAQPAEIPTAAYGVIGMMAVLVLLIFSAGVYHIVSSHLAGEAAQQLEIMALEPQPELPEVTVPATETTTASSSSATETTTETTTTQTTTTETTTETTTTVTDITSDHGDFSDSTTTTTTTTTTEAVTTTTSAASDMQPEETTTRDLLHTIFPFLE